MNYIGIDPGKAGAISFISEEEVLCFSTPLIGGDDYDIVRMKQILEYFTEAAKLNGHGVMVGLEDVHAIQGGGIGASSAFSFGEGKGIWRGLVQGLGLPIILIQPKSWQKVAWEGVTPITTPTSRVLKNGSFAQQVDTKSTSLIAAKRLFPQVPEVCPPIKCYADSPENRKSGIANQPLKKQPKPHDGIIDSLLIAFYLKKTN